MGELSKISLNDALEIFTRESTRLLPVLGVVGVGIAGTTVGNEVGSGLGSIIAGSTVGFGVGTGVVGA